MPITLQPPVGALGIVAPLLGPWFSQSVTLPALVTNATLGLDLTLAANTVWQAPATGTLSLFRINPAVPPRALDAMQEATGAFPFAAGKLVALFRLLPEVEARLHALVGAIPAATAVPITVFPNAAGPPSRPQVRSLALELPFPANPAPADFYALFPPTETIPGADDPEKLASLGFAVDQNNAITNAALPMTWLRRPGVSGIRDMLRLNGAARLWAFDRRGRAIDPGAVAAWWSCLLFDAVGPANAPQLMPASVAVTDYPQSGGGRRVVTTDAQLTAHLVDAHEGPAPAAFLNSRLKDGAGPVSATLVHPAATGGIALSIDALASAPPPAPPLDNPTVDTLPRPRIAVLPLGPYGNGIILWPSGPVHANLTRDFIRVALVEEELYLTGLIRQDSRTGTGPASRRRSAQNRPSTRIVVARTADTAQVLLSNSRAVADALLGLPNAAAPTRMVLGIADTAWGGTPAAAAILAPAPGSLPVGLTDSGAVAPQPNQYRVLAVTGGGAITEDRQTVLVEVALGTVGAGAWVRAWPQGFDLAAGIHFALTGGAGRADASGVARLTMTLANGRIDAAGALGMDLLVLLVDATGAVTKRRRYGDLRFARPAPIGGAALAAASVTNGWICETGAPLAGGTVPPGGHVLQLGTVPALVDRTTLSAAAWDARTLRNRLQPTDIVSLTAPAFRSTPDRADVLGRPLARGTTATGGDPRGGIDLIVAGRLHYLSRGLPDVAASSAPVALLDRLEVTAATVVPGVGGAAATASAAVGSTPPVPWLLEPAANFHHGFPGVPASIETHGVGATLTGPPAIAVAEYVRERTAGLGFTQVQSLSPVEALRSIVIQSEVALAAEAATPLPTIAEGTAAGSVVAVLRTVAPGFEGLPGAAVGATAPGTSLFPFSQNELALEAWLNTLSGSMGAVGSALRNAAAANIDSITRAIDRRILTSGYGAREALIALLPAIDRAQDLIFLETPAIDALTIASEGEMLSLWSRLIARLGQRKGLRVVLCVPTLPSAGTPARLQAVRDHCLLDAVDAIRAAAGDRFALFSPGAGAGRALRFASTSVVVDDAFALVGTTHLSRRGLSFDSSLAVSLFDQRLADGRPAEVRGLRLQLLADRLGIPPTRVPDDPAELVDAIRRLDASTSDRLSSGAIRRPDDPVQNGDLDIWNPDGSRTDLSLAEIAALLGQSIALTDVDHAMVEG